MLFNSWAFIIFYCIIVCLYFICPLRYRWILLLLGSCYFYMYAVQVYILVIFFIILANYFLAFYIEKTRGRLKKMYLFGSVFINLGILFFFKYVNFFSENVGAVVRMFHGTASPAHLAILLPLGLSFHTFQSLSYIIEVYRGNYPAERHLGIYALYVLFFPQLVAGPIERPQHFLPQLHAEHRFDLNRLLSGSRLMLWGFLKKVVIADRLAIVVNHVYAHLSMANGISIAIALLFFSFQVYTDFSAYTDIARGAARILGFDLVSNFNYPYFSRSIAEFWRRWHISLSSWFRDYVYIPLGGNRVSAWKKSVNIMIVFLLSGLWHGAGWTFIFWGALQGTGIIVESLTKTLRKTFTGKTGFLINYPHVRGAVQRLMIFALISFFWIFFRASTMHDAAVLITRLFTAWNPAHLMRDVSLLFSRFLSGLFPAWHINGDTGFSIAGAVSAAFGTSVEELLISFAAIGCLVLIEWFDSRQGLPSWLRRQSLIVQSACYSGAVFAIVFFGVFAQTQFIYFRF